MSICLSFINCKWKKTLFKLSHVKKWNKQIMHYTFSSVTEKAIQKIVLVLLNPFYFQNLSVQNIVPGKLPYTCFLNWVFCFIIFILIKPTGCCIVYYLQNKRTIKNNFHHIILIINKVHARIQFFPG